MAEAPQKGKYMEKQQYRQGDVFLEEVDPQSVPTQGRIPIPKDGNRTILAYGEVTGHAHAIVDPEDVEIGTQFFEFPNGDRFLVTPKGISLSHEEHGVIPLPAAMFKVTIQREYQEDGSWQSVMD